MCSTGRNFRQVSNASSSRGMPGFALENGGEQAIGRQHSRLSVSSVHANGMASRLK